jgi:hypothetical protein
LEIEQESTMSKATKATQLIAATVMAMLCHAVSAHAEATMVQAKYVTIGQAKDDLLAGTEKFALGASKVTEINLDPSTMGMVGEGHGPHAELASKLTLMVVHTYSYEKPGMYRQEDVETFRKKLQDGSWSCSIHTRDKERSTDICSRTAADHDTNEMVLFTTSPEKLTFIHIAGKMSLNDLEQAGGGVGGVIVHPVPPIPPIPPVPPEHVQPAPPAPPSAPLE